MNFKQHLKNEKEFLKRYIPDAISDSCDYDFVNNLPTGFLAALYGELNDIKDVKVDFEITPFDVETLFPKTGNNIKDDYIELSDVLDENEQAAVEIDQLILSFGRDAFGLYLPFHYYDKCWGIYLFKEIIESRVEFLYSIFKSKISLRELKQFYYYAVYRHELFHYQVERFATKAELITKNSTYKPSRDLFTKVRNTEHWLEEALAENSVLHSRLVTHRTGIPSHLLNDIYERDLQDMPPGYKDYHCKAHGGPIKAHNLIASQIIENRLAPSLILPQLVSIKNEFIALDKNVPTYLVTGFNSAKRIEL
jgi:hypothetical protein